MIAFAVLLALASGCGGDPVVGPAGGSDSLAIKNDAATSDVDPANQQDQSAVPADAPDAAGDSEPVGDAAADAAPECTSHADCTTKSLCLLGVCSATGHCQWTAKADLTPCDDGNACTADDLCSGGVCSGGPAPGCDDLNPCTADSCSPVQGCVHTSVKGAVACDDGNPCSSDDFCAGGSCEAGTTICQCQNSGDCAKFEDGNLCNGSLYCNKAKGPPYTCDLNPASVVTCSTAMDSPCQKNTCIPSTGACKLLVSPQNSPCDDGDSCTAGDSCSDGLCQAGTNVCLCKKDADCAAFEDGNACNGTLFCNKAKAACQINPITVVTCKTVDDTSCLQNVCNPKEGKCHLIPVHEGKLCDDGNPCTPSEICAAGACSSATNTCDCQKDADCQAKDDGNACNGTLYCDVASHTCAVNPATVVHCDRDDDPACLADTCDPKTGKCSEIALPKDGTACDDGNPCTLKSLCSAGKCAAQANVCQCQTDADCAGKEDENLCNGTLYCDPTSNHCEVNDATVVQCPGAFDEACLANQCDPATGGCGMRPAHQGNQCDDGSLCSAGGWCALGTCEITVKQACECVQDADCAKVDDGDLCNGTLYCDKTGAKPICKVNPATLVVCKTVDDTACSKAQCQPKTGQCAMTPVSGPCSDGKACTTSDTCGAGTCVGLAKVCSDGIACTADSCQEPFGCVFLPGSASSCDDGNPCTGDTCDLQKGCVGSPTAGPCDDGNPCTQKDTCITGQCQGATGGCDDGNPCTADACTGGTCSHTPGSGAACSDGNACTVGDACAAGTCAPGKAKVCSDDLSCTADTCDPQTGTCNYQEQAATLCDDKNPCTDEQCVPVFGCVHVNTSKTCNDGDPCTVGEACQNGKCGGGAPNACDDGNPCTDDSCDTGKGGCVTVANTLPCNDGVGCTQNDSCQKGACTGTILCDDGDPCTLDKCDTKTGKCATLPFDNAPCDDGNPCTAQEICKGGTCAFGVLTNCGDGNECTDDACDKQKGCYHYPNSGPCTTGACTLDDYCSGGACKLGSTPGAGELFPDLATGSATRPAIRGTVYANKVMFAYGGVAASTMAAPDSVATAWVAKGDLAGHWSWQVSGQPIGGGDSVKLAVRAFANKLGGIDVVYKTNADRPTAVRYDASGKAVTIVAAPQPNGVTIRDAVQRPGSGDIVAVGYHAVPGFSYGMPWLNVHGAADLAVTATVVSDEFKYGLWLHGATLGPDGQSVATVGRIGSGAYSYLPVLVLWGPKLDPVTKIVTPVPGTAHVGNELNAVAPIAGGYVAAGTLLEPGDGQGLQMLVARFDELGKLRWHNKYQFGDKGVEEGFGVLGFVDGSILAAGTITPAGATTRDVILLRLDQKGGGLLGKTIAGPGNDFVYHLQQVGPGVVVANGMMSTSTGQRGWLLRATPELQMSCSTAGACLQVGFGNCAPEVKGGCNLATCEPNKGACSLTFVEGATCSDGDACTFDDKCDLGSKSCVTQPLVCDDKNVCTAETCDNKLGCVYSDVPDGTQCGFSAVCGSGVCKTF
ncbi:MAG: hypothetical protein HY902_15490 [Deltaproteobacteria bacterium]|nr:hypothetical protein [Deltaproteobacteria bacterium]